eukprot:SAG11_NODE_28906_length_316_cov_0.953917_1_plen_40_part_10
MEESSRVEIQVTNAVYGFIRRGNARNYALDSTDRTKYWTK